jgi:hypothetical protein
VWSPAWSFIKLSLAISMYIQHAHTHAMAFIVDVDAAEELKKNE